MNKNKLKVIKLDPKYKEVVLMEKQSPLMMFLKNHRLHIAIILLIFGLLFLLTSGYIFLTNLEKNKQPVIKTGMITTTLNDYHNIVVDSIPMTEKTAKNEFLQDALFKNNGEILLVKTIIKDNYIIKFYSDGTALKIIKNNTLITRISPLKNGQYGIKEDGTTYREAVFRDVKIVTTKEYDWGLVHYFSDGSAEIINSKIDMFVRNSSQINENYISNNKVSYLKETKMIDKYIVNYYYDGTIEVVDGAIHHLIRNSNDINILNNKITFSNNNDSYIYETKILEDGVIINYFTDGGAIIITKTSSLSVRKSNSIIIKNNKIYEIVDNIYVNISSTSEDGIIYYTNGGAEFNYQNKVYYTDENSNLKYQNKKLSSIEGTYESLINETSIENEQVKTFTKTAIIRTDTYIKIVPSDCILYDKFGKIKYADVESEKDNNKFTIRNDSNETLKYRIVIEESDKSDLDLEYIRYQMQVKEKYYPSKKLKDTLWKKDKLQDTLKLSGRNYILLEDIIEPYDVLDIRLMLWTDYDTIPNTMQGKSFYGTIKVYAWK